MMVDTLETPSEPVLMKTLLEKYINIYAGFHLNTKFSTDMDFILMITFLKFCFISVF